MKGRSVMMKRVKTTLLAAGVFAATVTGLFWSGEVIPTGSSGFVTEAHAIIGRPLTPMSYAGVARRTVRRCAVGVYYC
jgi:hypothetical protein